MHQAIVSLKPRILIAEDNVTLRKVVSASLRSRSQELDFVIVENGQEAVDAAANGQFDLILMDLHMPVMDGFKATEEIRRHERNSTRRATIVAVSCDEERKALCREVGMDGHEQKPANYSKVIQNWLRVPALA